MRMRLKSNLTERLNNCKENLIEVNRAEKNVNIALLNKEYINFDKHFPINQKIHLDLGCGKGGFSIKYAKLHPEINVIGVEMISNVIISALEEIKDNPLSNLKFMNTGADYLLKYFRPNSVDRIYLNFSTPKQKNSYANSRLTSPRFLEIYRQLLSKDGEIHQKTDDGDFFAYSVEQFEENNFENKFITYDLHKEVGVENIITEYEQNFLNQGKKIMKIVVKPN